MKFNPLRFYSFLIIIAFISCKKETTFEAINSSHSGIHFKNEIIENDSINPIELVNIYNGGGVGIGDFNNDNLQDIYFTGNQVSNKLYINKGDLRFEDVTSEANVDGLGRWGRGVAVVDINNDGLLDLYICNTLDKDSTKRENILYVNQGIKNGVPIFKDMAKEYGLNANRHSTMASFFDYDNDGDLDMYLVVNESVKAENPSKFRPIITDGSFVSTGKLYRNDFSSALKHPVYQDVSREAGITIEGYGHGVTIADINVDGWKDIYVSNDFLSNNILYINNHNGTFTDKTREYFKHTSANSMGQDIVDVNNDGLADVIELDMDPEDNFRKKMMQNAISYQTYQNFDRFGYQYQYTRNTLQLNQGPRVLSNDSIGAPVFSEIGFLSGIEATDWSWTPLINDFDNDGNKDMIVTNGYPRDVTDHDFIAFRQQSYSIATTKQILEQVPQVKLHNYAFKNNGDLTFTNVSKEWGMEIPTFSNGAAYADLDNDGDLDVIINNINDEASVFKNTSSDTKSAKTNYLELKFIGGNNNKNGLGALAEIYYDNKKQVIENTPYRGYLSSVQNSAHFGLGSVTEVDSLIVNWPNGFKQVLNKVKVNQIIPVNIKNADKSRPSITPKFAYNALFKDVTNKVDIHFKHKESDFVDFNIQKLLPHKLSEYSPALAVGDIDNNSFDDFICAGSDSTSAQLFLQQKDGKFLQKSLFQIDLSNKRKDSGLLLFDVDMDGDLDLYISSGGYEYSPNSAAYQDHIYLNDGKANFVENQSALPKNFTSKFCVRAIDYDKDGDLDMFIAGRVEPWSYPKPVSSFIYRNDTQSGKVKFTDVTASVAKELLNIGLVCDAVFTDFDNDGWPDLVLAGEWMPITFFKNTKGVFKNITTGSGLENHIGWWNTIAPGDFDNDGDIDYIVGNLGRNSFFKATEKYPVHIIAKDFDKNESYDAFPSLYLPDVNGELKEFPAHTRDDMVKQMISTRLKFQNYKSYAVATMDDILSPEQKEGALRLKANYFQSSFIRNEGKGNFTISPLPLQAQLSVLNGITVNDFDLDGNLDVIINGNDFGTDVSVGRYDALNGLYLKGNGNGSFSPLSILQCGIFIPGNGKALVKLKGVKDNCLIVASQNKGSIKVFQQKKPVKMYTFQPLDVSATIKYKNGKRTKEEFYYGSSFLSQSGRFINLNSNIKSITVTNNKGISKNIDVN